MTIKELEISLLLNWVCVGYILGKIETNKYARLLLGLMVAVSFLMAMETTINEVYAK